MALPALVLVHGGGLGADSWDLTVDEIHRRAPELTVLAVDLPGRRGKHGDLLTLTIADFVDSVVGDIEDAGLGEIVLVGHSMAGLTVPGVVTKLGSSRVREMILANGVRPTRGQGSRRRDHWSVCTDRPTPRRKTHYCGDTRLDGEDRIPQRNFSRPAAVHGGQALSGISAHTRRERFPPRDARRRTAHLDNDPARSFAIGQNAAQRH